jgi:hypothetical protein
MRVPSVTSHAPVRGAVVAPDLADAVAPLGRAAAAALLPWRLHRADWDEAEQYFAVVAADGVGLAGAHRREMGAAAESELGLSQERVNAIGSEERCTEMQLPGVVLNG